MKRKVFFWFVAGIFAWGLVSRFCGGRGCLSYAADSDYRALPAGRGCRSGGPSFCGGLEKHLKQPVVVVNKTGAGGAVGMQAAAVSKPDGYTLMVALSSISVMPEVDALFGRPSDV